MISHFIEFQKFIRKGSVYSKTGFGKKSNASFALSIGLLYPPTQLLQLTQFVEEDLSALNIYLTGVGVYIAGRFIDYFYPEHDAFGPFYQEFLNYVFPILSITSIVLSIITALIKSPKILLQGNSAEEIEAFFNSPEISNELKNNFLDKLTPKPRTEMIAITYLQYVIYIPMIAVLCDLFDRLSRVIAMQLVIRTTQLPYPENIFQTETLLFKLQMPANINEILMSTIKLADGKEWSTTLCLENYTGKAEKTAQNLFELSASQGKLTDFLQSRPPLSTLENIIEASIQVLSEETQKNWFSHFNASSTDELTTKIVEKLLACFKKDINTTSDFIFSIMHYENALVPTSTCFNKEEKPARSNAIDDFYMKKLLLEANKNNKSQILNLHNARPVTQVEANVDTEAFDCLVNVLSQCKNTLFEQGNAQAEALSATAQPCEHKKTK